MIAGHRYALVVETVDRYGGLQTPALFNWYYGSPDVYPGGQMLLYDGAWKQAASPIDAAFKTYITPVPMTSLPPPPADDHTLFLRHLSRGER